MQVAVVTGAGAGIGQAIAIRLAQEGMAIVVADIDPRHGRQTVARILGDGRQAIFAQADMGKERDVRAMIELAQQRYGGLDILVNNAGIATEPNFPQADPAHWGYTLDVNLRGTMLAIQFAMKVMEKRGGGVVVNISSMAGMVLQSYDAPEYAASKAGIIHLTAALGFLKEQHNIRVNCIVPGWVETEAVREFLAEMRDEDLAHLDFPPPQELIQPEEIAEAVLMFVKDDSLAGRVMLWPDGENWQMLPVKKW